MVFAVLLDEVKIKNFYYESEEELENPISDAVTTVNLYRSSEID